MDDIVVRGMARWPDVPDVYGWLALDRRGRWLVKGRSGGFERIGNAAVCEFINRNYQRDVRGRWFFQNGPQRVFVNIDRLPLVYRIEDHGARLSAHTGMATEQPRAAWLDDAGGMVIETELGAGALDDRDLALALSLMRDASGAVPGDAVLADVAAGRAGAGLAIRFGAAVVPVGSVALSQLASRFGFDPAPRPPAGQPDC